MDFAALTEPQIGLTLDFVTNRLLTRGMYTFLCSDFDPRNFVCLFTLSCGCLLMDLSLIYYYLY